ncbi:MAG: hypothetical protein U0R64_03480 [Candidatus Nanopelagicales bacterium]
MTPPPPPPMAVQRPGTITFIVVLMWINAVIEIIGGVFLMLGATNNSFVRGFNEGAGVDDLNGTTLAVAGLITIAFGIITILLATGLKNGSNGVRIFVSILIVLQILVDVAELTVWRNSSVWTGLIAILIWLIILAMLWGSRASAFFTQPKV